MMVGEMENDGVKIKWWDGEKRTKNRFGWGCNVVYTHANELDEMYFKVIGSSRVSILSSTINFLIDFHNIDSFNKFLLARRYGKPFWLATFWLFFPVFFKAYDCGSNFNMTNDSLFLNRRSFGHRLTISDDFFGQFGSPYWSPTPPPLVHGHPDRNIFCISDVSTLDTVRTYRVDVNCK